MRLVTLDLAQFSLVYNMLSLAVAAMGAAFVFFLVQRGSVHPNYRIAVTLSALVVLVAFYHYLRIFDSWNGAFVYDPMAQTFVSGVEGTHPFNDGYRYVDWLITVPLLLAELVLVLRLEAAQSRSLLTRLVVAAVLMIVLGYPGEISPASELMGARGLWFVLSMIPFLYILWILFGELTRSLDRQSDRVKGLVGWLRLIVLITWSVYPIAYLLPSFITDAATAEVIRQVGYSIADILAKPAFGLLVFAVAMAKSEAEPKAA
jgi:bacteriorhodopsin